MRCGPNLGCGLETSGECCFCNLRGGFSKGKLFIGLDIQIVLQQLYEPEPAGAKPARAGLGSSSSRAEPWGAGSKRLSCHRPLTGSWPVPLSSLHTALLFGYFSAHLFSILYQITTFYRIYHDLFRPHTHTIVSLPIFKVSIMSACVMLACLAMQSCLLLTDASSSSSRSCLLFTSCKPFRGDLVHLIVLDAQLAPLHP